MTPWLDELLTTPARWQVAATIAVPSAQAAELVLAVEPGRVGDGNALVLGTLPSALRGALTIVAGPTPETFEAIGADEPIELAIAPTVPAIAVRNGVTGLHTVEPTTNGCRVVHRVYAVRPQTGDPRPWLREELTHVVRVIADRCGAPHPQ